jgi:hypothetical protein
MNVYIDITCETRVQILFTPFSNTLYTYKATKGWKITFLNTAYILFGL